MRVRRVLPLIAFCLLALSSVVDGKGRVEARLTTRPPADAQVGTQIPLAWALLDSDGLPFNSDSVFVRLVGASASTIASASGSSHLKGDYDAVIRVPEGGIAQIEIGVRGTRSDSNGTQPSEILFPIVDTPPPARSDEATFPPAYSLPLVIMLFLVGVSVAGLIVPRFLMRKPTRETEQ
jgi:hypothetical protein